MDPMIAAAALGSATLAAAAAWVHVSSSRKRPALIPVRVRRGRRR